MTYGLADHEIQLDLLGDKNQDMSLEEVIQYMRQKKPENGQLVVYRKHNH
jgi:hypothetical protein